MVLVARLLYDYSRKKKRGVLIVKSVKEVPQNG